MRKLSVLATVFPLVLGVFACAQNMRVHGMALSRSAMPVLGGRVEVCNQTAITAASEMDTNLAIPSALSPKAGQSVRVSGVTPAGYNGIWRVNTTSPTQFTSTASSAGLGAGTPFGAAIPTTPAPCVSLTPLCASLTDTVCTQPSPVTRDGSGNYSFNVPVASGPYTGESYGSGIAARAQPDQSGNGFGTVDLVRNQTIKGNKLFSGVARCGNLENVRCVDAPNTPAWAGTDVCGWINAAYAASPSNGAPIIVYPGAYLCASGSFITAGTNNKPLIMICQNGATSLIGASPPGVCQITFSDTTHPGITVSDGAGMGAGVSGFTLIGPGTATATIGISVAFAVGHVFQNNDISGFGVGLQVATTTNSEYINTFWTNAIHDNGQNLNFPNGGTSVENDAFYGGRITNQAAAFVANCINIGGGVEVHFYNVSIDQCGMTLHGAQPKVSMTGGHFENPISGTAIPFFTSAADVTGAVVTMDGVLWIEDVASARTEFASILGAGQYNFSNSLFQTEGGPVAAAVTVNNGNAAVLTQNLSLVGVTNAFTNTLSNSVLNIAPGNVQYITLGESAFAVGFSVDHNYVTTLYGQYPETNTLPAALASKDRCYADATSHTIQCSYNGKPFHSMTQGIGAGTSTTNGTAIAAGTSQAQPGISLSGATATDVALCSLNASPPASWQTGIQMLPPVVTAGVVTPWLSNPTAGSITPVATAIRCVLFR